MRFINLNIRFLFIGLLSLFWLSISSEEPFLVLFCLDICLCLYLVSCFKHRFRFLFLLHPIVLLLSGQLYEDDWLTSGDGNAIASVLSSYIDIGVANPLPVDLQKMGESGESGLLGLFKFASFGAVPTYIVPYTFFEHPVDAVYYVWQGVFHIILCSITVTLVKYFAIIKDEYLFSFILFAAISPTFWELAQVPTRHLVTFFGLSLLFFTHLSILKQFSMHKAFWWVIALFIMLGSKSIYLLSYIPFVLFDLFIIRGVKINKKYFGLIIALGFISLSFAPYFISVVGQYSDIAQTGGNTFPALTQIPIFGWVIKYLYAFLAPFPWLPSYSTHHVQTIFTGNLLIFIMHIFSSITGLYFLNILIIKSRRIWALDDDFKSLMAYGIIMSATILGGSIGFHGYLSIFFPFFAPLLLYKNLRILPVIPILAPVALNILLLFL